MSRADAQIISSLRSSRSTSAVKPFLAAWITLLALSSDTSAITYYIRRADYPAYTGQWLQHLQIKAASYISVERQQRILFYTRFWGFVYESGREILKMIKRSLALLCVLVLFVKSEYRSRVYLLYVFYIAMAMTNSSRQKGVY